MDSVDGYAQLIRALHEEMTQAVDRGGLRDAASKPDLEWLSQEAERFGVAPHESRILSLGATVDANLSSGFLAAVNAARSLQLITRQTAREARLTRVRSRRLRASTRSLGTQRMADRLLA